MYENKYSRSAALKEARQSRAKRMKSRIMAVALAGVLAVSGTLAFIVVKSDQVSNSFAPSSVSCAVDESLSLDKTSKQDVRIQNTGDTTAYVRAALVINWVDADGNVVGNVPEGYGYEVEGSLPANGLWKQAADGYFYYSDPVAAGATTELLIKEIAPTSTIDKGDQTCFLHVEVVASAVQADGKTGEVPAVVDAWGNATNNLSVSAGKLVVTSMA